MSQPDEEVDLTTPEFREAIKQATDAFFEEMKARHVMGEEKYGPLKFMKANTLTEAMAEVVDLANYAMYTFVKLWFLNLDIQAMTEPRQIPHPRIGPDSFMSSIPPEGV